MRNVLFLVLLIALARDPVAAQSKVYPGHVRIDGRAIAVDFYYPAGAEPYLALDTLAGAMRWQVVDDGRSRQVQVQGKWVQAARFRGRTFVSNQSLAQALQFRREEKAEHRWIDLWSPTTTSAGAARLSIREKKKWDNGVGRDVGYDVNVTVRNVTDAVLPLTGQSFVLVDRAGKRYPCLGQFSVGVPAGGEKNLWGPYFMVPYQHDLAELLLVNEKGEVVDRARW